jgi:hypothetical protein
MDFCGSFSKEKDCRWKLNMDIQKGVIERSSPCFEKSLLHARAPIFVRDRLEDMA